jgi:hypothetical protein
MKISVKSIKKELSRDSQRSKVYSMDRLLKKTINQRIKVNEIDLTKLYGELEDKNDIIKLTEKIFDDFSLSGCTACVSNSATFSFCRSRSITYTSFAFTNNDIETVIHEVSHLVINALFGYHSDGHGALYVTVFKYLLNYYNLINNEDFDKINQMMTGNKVKEFSDYFIDFKFISNNQADELISKYEIKERSYSSSFEHLKFKDLNGNFEIIIRKNLLNNKSIYIKRNLFLYEEEGNVFSKMTNKDLLNTVLFSPPHKMCCDGYPSRTKYYSEYGYSYLEVSTVREDKLRECSDYEHTQCKVTAKTKLEEAFKNFKENGFNCRKFNNLREFENIKSQLHDEIYKRNGNCIYL